MTHLEGLKLNVHRGLEHLEPLTATRELTYEAWLEARRSFVGSSDIGTVMGVNDYTTVLELWAHRTGKIERDPVISRAARFGKHVEPALLKLFAEDHPEICLEPNSITFRSIEFPFAACTPDSFAARMSRTVDDIEVGIVEAKHSGGSWEPWKDGDAPAVAQVQTVWQMGLTRRTFGYITAIIGGRANEVIEPYFDFDDTAKSIFEQCLERAEKFVQAVQRDIPPAAGPGDRKVIERLIEDRGGVCQLPDSMIDVVENLIGDLAYVKNVKAQLKEPNDRIDFYKTQLLEKAAGAAVGELSNGRRVNFKKVFNKGHTVEPYSYWLVNPK